MMDDRQRPITKAETELHVVTKLPHPMGAAIHNEQTKKSPLPSWRMGWGKFILLAKSLP